MPKSVGIASYFVAALLIVAAILVDFIHCEDNSGFYREDSQQPYHNSPISYNYPNVNNAQNYQPIGSYDDLQTSDLASDLQLSLPQYHQQQPQQIDDSIFFNQRSYALPNLNNNNEPSLIYPSNNNFVKVPLKRIQNVPKNSRDKVHANSVDTSVKPTIITTTTTSASTPKKYEYDDSYYYDDYNEEGKDSSSVTVFSVKQDDNGTSSEAQEVTPSSTTTTTMTPTTFAPVVITGMPQKVDNSSENWMVVASVQTSRSVSGVRYLSFPFITQVRNDTKSDDVVDKPKVDLDKNSGFKINNGSDISTIGTTSTTTVVPLTTVTKDNVPISEMSPIVGKSLDGSSNVRLNHVESNHQNKLSNRVNAIKPKFIEDISKFLPANFIPTMEPGKKELPVKTPVFITSTADSSRTTVGASTSTEKSPSKIVFPTRPGGKKFIYKTTTVPTFLNSNSTTSSTISTNKATVKLKEWPKRSSTQFTGWSIPTAIPISIEKLLEAAKKAAASAETKSSTTTDSVGTTSTTKLPQSTIKFATTTNRATTPGICLNNCDLAATVKLVGGAKWVPELLNRNTKEWQILANEVQTKLEDAFRRSDMLRKWYKRIRIEEFSEGSVLVDYYVELANIQDDIDTKMIKKMFHDTLFSSFDDDDDGDNNNGNGKLNLGHFVIDPNYTDFIVIPKRDVSNIKSLNDDDLLPQWAIAVIVIGFASLIFVALFGLSVLINRKKSTKIKQRIPFTEEMIHEYNKNHMGGFDNYGVEDLYNMEDVWNEKPYDFRNVTNNGHSHSNHISINHNLKKKKLSSSSIQDNSLSHLYDSWRSEWNGYYLNAYHNGGYSSRSNYYSGSNANGAASGSNGSGGSSSQTYMTRRKADYDTNF